MRDLLIPSAVKSAITISADTQKMWKGVVWSVKQAQDRFIEAYKATLTELIPGWEKTWKENPHFSKSLGDIESYISQLCRTNGMPLTVFNKYRGAARKSVLLKVPFTFAASNFTIPELKEIATGGVGTAKVIRKEKNLHHAATQVSHHATILPLPSDDVHVDDYLATVKSRMQDHLRAVTEKFGPDVTRQLLLDVATL